MIPWIFMEFLKTRCRGRECQSEMTKMSLRSPWTVPCLLVPLQFSLGRYKMLILEDLIIWIWVNICICISKSRLTESVASMQCNVRKIHVKCVWRHQLSYNWCIIVMPSVQTMDFLIFRKGYHFWLFMSNTESKRRRWYPARFVLVHILCFPYKRNVVGHRSQNLCINALKQTKITAGFLAYTFETLLS